MLLFLSVEVNILLKPRGLVKFYHSMDFLYFQAIGQGIAEDSDNATHALSCLLTLGLVYLLDQSKCFIFQQSFCSTLKAYYWIPLIFLEQQDSHYVGCVTLAGMLDPPLGSILSYHSLCI